jgi:uncharacterized OsmC-like protein
MGQETNKINGLNIEATREAIKTVGAQPANSRAPKKSRCKWLGGLKFKTYVRNHVFLVDEPAHLAGEDESPNSMEYVLGAYGACLATGFVLNASQKGIEIHNLEVAVDSTQNNVFTFLGVAEAGDGHPGFDTIHAKLFVQADADEDTIREIWARTVDTSPVHNSLTRTVRIEPEVEIVP